jgi:hypothetical protein
MPPNPESILQAPGLRTRESELLAKVVCFRKELDSIMPSGLNNKSLVNSLRLAARDIEIALSLSDKTRAPLNDFDLSQKEKLIESSERHFSVLLAFRAEVSSLIDSRMAERKETVRGTPRKHE